MCKLETGLISKKCKSVSGRDNGGDITVRQFLLQQYDYQ